MEARSVGPYRILEKLGEGGMGEVYLAEDLRLRRRVALKALSGARAQAPDARRRLIHEARAAAALNHPNIAAIYDVVDGEDGAYIVMEYVPGETLADRLHGGPLPVSAVLEIALQLADALVEAHSRGVIHRDLKPANVVVTPDGRVKVLDFGLAKTHLLPRSEPDPAASDPPSSSSAGVSGEGRWVVGTPPYVSPEHLLGQPVDERSDIYSFGVLLYELLTGRRPFDGQNLTALAMAILTATPRPIRDLNTAVPEALEELVLRAMRRDPVQRPSNARLLRIDISRLADALNTPPTRSVPFGLPRLKGSAARRPWPRTALALLAAVLAVSVAADTPHLYSTHVAPPVARDVIPVLAVLPFSNTSGDSAMDDAGVGIAEVLISSVARLPGISVLSRSATVGYRGPRRDLDALARDLDVDFVVDGVLQRSRESIRVTMSLVDVASKKVAWSDTYDAGVPELFSLQRHVAEAVAASLKLRFSPRDRHRVERPATTSTEAFAEYAQGLALRERPDIPNSLDRAISLFEAAIGREPGFSLAHAALGRAYWAKFDASKRDELAVKATSEMAEALRLDPDLAAVRYTLAAIYRDTGRPVEAMDELHRALQIQPDYDDAHRLLGEILASRGQTEEALSAFRRAIEIRPGYWWNHASLGLARFDSGAFEDAAKEFERITELQPDNAWGYQMLGTAQQGLGRIPEALRSYERANLLAPRASTYSNIGTLHYAAGEIEQAVAAYQKALAIDQNLPQIHRNLGDALRRLGRNERANASYREAVRLTAKQLQINPKDPRTLAMLAVYEAKLGRFDDATRHAAEAAAGSAADAAVLYRRAVVCALAEQPEQALLSLEGAVALGFSTKLAREDEDLAILRKTPRFRSLLSHDH